MIRISVVCDTPRGYSASSHLGYTVNSEKIVLLN